MILPPELAAADAAIRRQLGIRGGRRKVKRKWHAVYCRFCRHALWRCICPLEESLERYS